MLCGLGMAQQVGKVLLYYVFYYSKNDNSQLQSNSQEFACNLNSGYISIIFGGLFFWIILIILLMNVNRYKFTRFKFALLADSFIRPVAYGTEKQMQILAADDTPRMLCLGVARGTWVPPFARAFVANSNKNSSGGDMKPEIICCDVFESKYFSESSAWFIENMKSEGLANSIKLKSWATYERFSQPTESIDVLYFPIGFAYPYLSELEDLKEKKNRYVEFLNECHRVLKPNGVIITSNMKYFGVQKAWEDALSESYFKNGDQEEYMTALPGNIWWTFVPSVISIVKKTKSVTYVEVEEEEVEEGRASRASITVVKSKNNPNSALLELPMFPSGLHWRLIEGLIFFTLLLWAIFVLITWRYLKQLQVPTFLPYGDQVYTLFIGNITILPFVIYSIFQKLRQTAEKIEVNKQTRGKDMDPSTSNSHIRSAIWSVYKHQMVDVLLLLTFQSIISWAPYAFADFIMYKYSSLSLEAIGYIDTIIVFVVLYIFGKYYPKIKIWYLALKLKQEAEQDDLLNRVTEMDDVGALTTNILHEGSLKKNNNSL